MNSFASALNLLLFSIMFLTILFVSGNATLLLIGPHRGDLPMDLRIPLAIIVGLSLIPICLLWTSILNLELSSAFAFFYLGASVSINLFALVLNRSKFLDGWTFSLNTLRQNRSFKSLMWLGAIFFLTWITRFIAVKGFLVAPGADSYHHTLITSLITQTGQIPTSYEPYAPRTPFTYHFGFHAIGAFMYWLTGIPLPKLVLWAGQGLNALTVLSMYFFVKQLTRHDLTALVASFLVGLVAVFPAYMINWSRFTQLSGLVILTLTIGLIIVPANRSYWQIVPLLVGAIFLSHYRIFAMFGWLVGASLLVEVASSIISDWQPDKVKQQLKTVLLVSAGLIIVAPWLFHFLSYSRLFELTTYVAVATQTDTLRSYYDLNRLDAAPRFYSNYWLLLLGLIGLVQGFFKYRKITSILVLWVGLILLWSNPYWLPIPGAGMLDLNSVVMSLFGPIVFFAALGVVRLASEIVPKSAINWSNGWGWRLALAGFTLFAVIQMSTIANADYVYVRATDLQAMDWIKTHTETNTKFLINPALFEGWEANALAGNDAGYWIPLLAERQTTILPMVVATEKITPTILYTQDSLAQIAINPTLSSLATLKQEKVTHVFVGERGGPISLSTLENTTCTTEVWHKGATRIFELNYDCSR